MCRVSRMEHKVSPPPARQRCRLRPHTYRDSQGHIFKLTHTHTYTQSSKPAVVDGAKALSRNHTKPLSISAPKSRPHFLSARSAAFCGSAFVPTHTLIHNLLGRQLTRPTPEANIHAYRIRCSTPLLQIVYI